MKYKMVCIDMDGTLLGKRKKISEFSKDIIKKAHDMGVEIVVTTGRLYNNAAYFSQLLGVDSPVIAANGAIVIDQKTNDIIYESAIPEIECMNILKILNKYKIPFHFHTTDTIYCNNWFSKFGTQVYMTKQVYYEHLNINYYTVKTEKEWAEVFKKESGRMAKCIAFSPKSKSIFKVRKELDNLENIVYFGSGNHSTEINFKGVSKGNSVKVLSEKYGIKREELICIGDNENDISMIKYAGLGIAMANAIDEVKAAAQYITDSNKNDGVAKAIKKFILDQE